MKKGAFNNFLGRKRDSLFDTNVEFKERENVELFIEPSAIPESGTAKVRARPTVKHIIPGTTSSDAMHGFAVPTPTVPVLSTFKGPDTNGTDGKLPNGGSIPELLEDDIHIPPPPSMAPPPPPSFAPPPPPPQYFIPPPDYCTSSTPPPEDKDYASLQPPPMAPPKPPSKTPSPHSSWEPDLDSLKPPPMAPPKPPSDPSTPKVFAPISTPQTNGPEGPTFTPPKPLASSERLQTTPPKAQKDPPLKPVRFSSIPSQENLQFFPAQASSGPTPSSFNPQVTAKLHSVSKSGILLMERDVEKPPKPILLLEDGSNDPIPIQVDGKVPSDSKDLGSVKSQVPPTKPARRNSGGLQLEKDLQNLKENLQSTLPAEVVKVQEKAPVTPTSLPASQELNKPAQHTPTGSPIRTPPYSNSPGRTRKLIPSVGRTPYYRRVPEGGTSATSPLALLQAAKEREKQRNSLSRENSSKSNSYSEPATVSIHQSESTPNSFTVTPRPNSSLSQGGRDSPDLHYLPNMGSNSASPSPSRPLSSNSLVAELLEKNEEEEAPAAPNTTRPEDVPAPPPAPAVQPPLSTVPAPPPKPKAAKPPSPPQLPVPKTEVKPQQSSQDKQKLQPPFPPGQALSPSQATLLSILQKKMMEMEQKHAVQEDNSSNDGWVSPDESTVKTSPFAKAKSTPTLPRQSTGLDMSELERKVTQKAQDLSPVTKSATSNGSQSKQGYGATFTVRPGTKQPIMPLIKGDAPSDH
ncbi:hypothetical protein GJAV_G00179020 [Gymnothorax javanicus]|nr:hypothetical protein GJAV_G00179020 [Gymnothorax javanicus]